eukprot:SM000085S23274  [mRNA]  locus=s85:532344:533920:+ [translate_table: standard]
MGGYDDRGDGKSGVEQPPEYAASSSSSSSSAERLATLAAAKLRRRGLRYQHLIEGLPWVERHEVALLRYAAAAGSGRAAPAWLQHAAAWWAALCKLHGGLTRAILVSSAAGTLQAAYGSWRITGAALAALLSYWLFRSRTVVKGRPHPQPLSNLAAPPSSMPTWPSCQRVMGLLLQHALAVTQQTTSAASGTRHPLLTSSQCCCCRPTAESVVVLHALGIQLEAHHRSGWVKRHFVPFELLAAAVINEAVTPTICYFYLALLIAHEDHLLLAFPVTRPPLEVLVPVRNSLTAALSSASGALKPKRHAGDSLD